MTSIGQPLARYAAFKRAGDFIFFSGVIAFDPETRAVVSGFEELPERARLALGETGELSVDIFEAPILVQSWFVLERIRQMIEAEGGSMQDVFKLVQYFRDLRHYPYYNRVRKLFYPTDPPVSTIVEVSRMLPNDAVLIEVEGTAYLPKRST
jgi:enamine deaminase RidA (YjgF/YER057c/UK114 family)